MQAWKQRSSAAVAFDASLAHDLKLVNDEREVVEDRVERAGRLCDDSELDCPENERQNASATAAEVP